MLYKIISSFGLLLMLSSCQGTSNSLRLKGTVDISDGNSILHIIADSNNQPKVLDTLFVESGTFNLEVEITEPSIHFLQIEYIKRDFLSVLAAVTHLELGLHCPRQDQVIQWYRASEASHSEKPDSNGSKQDVRKPASADIDLPRLPIYLDGPGRHHQQNPRTYLRHA